MTVLPDPIRDQARSRKAGGIAGKLPLPDELLIQDPKRKPSWSGLEGAASSGSLQVLGCRSPLLRVTTGSGVLSLANPSRLMRGYLRHVKRIGCGTLSSDGPIPFVCTDRLSVRTIHTLTTPSRHLAETLPQSQ
jgi:hypothetical protein